MDLAAFLTARLGEDERDGYSTHRWECFSLGLDQPAEGLACNCGYPARVLRDVEAKRKIIALMGTTGDYGPVEWDPDDEVLLALAAVYSDHPDYDPEWKAV